MTPAKTPIPDTTETIATPPPQQISTARKIPRVKAIAF